MGSRYRNGTAISTWFWDQRPRCQVTVLRNNADGTFKAIEPFEGRLACATSYGPISMKTATLMLYFSTLRRGSFLHERASRPFPASVRNWIGSPQSQRWLSRICTATGRSAFWSLNPRHNRTSNRSRSGQSLTVVDIRSSAKNLPGCFQALRGDLDNNGALDIIFSGYAGGWIGLGDESLGYRTVPVPADFTFLMS